MECCARIEVIDGYEVVVWAGERTPDPQETYNYVRTHFPNAKKSDVDQLFEEHKVYAPLQENERSLPDNTCHQLKEKLTALSEHEKYLFNGAIIADYRGAEYWGRKDGRWGKNMIEKLGETIPAGAIQVDELNNEQHAEERDEIREQEEEDRIAALSLEALEKEKQSALDALADEAARLEKRYQIQGKEFDPVAWYKEEAKKVSEKYRD